MLLLIVLSNQFNHKQPNNMFKTKKSTPIKSFLYTPINIVKNENSIEKTTNEVESEPAKKNKLTPSNQKNAKQQISPTLSSEQVKNIKGIIKNTLPTKKRIITKQRLMDQVNALNTTIYNTPVNKKNTLVKSIFNPTPALVTKSNTRSELQKEHDKKLKLTNYGNGIVIKKNKNGNCSVKQDLSSVGIEGASAIQYFKCGKSEFDMNFDQHMKQAMNKYK